MPKKSARVKLAGFIRGSGSKKQEPYFAIGGEDYTLDKAMEELQKYISEELTKKNYKNGDVVDFEIIITPKWCA